MLFYYLIYYDILLSDHLLLLLFFLLTSVVSYSLAKSLIQVFVVSLGSGTATKWTRLHALLITICGAGCVCSRFLGPIDLLCKWSIKTVRTDSLHTVRVDCLASRISSSFTCTFKRLHFNSLFNLLFSKINLSILAPINA